VRPYFATHFAVYAANVLSVAVAVLLVMGAMEAVRVSPASK
jgi:hypothetical protein